MAARYRNSYASYFLIYLFWYLSWALSSQLISVYLLGKGFTATETSLVVTAAFVASMFSQPVIGNLGDKRGVKRVSLALFALTIVGAVMFVFSAGLVPTLVSYAVLMALMNGANPVMERVATASPYEYGRIRVWGTIGYAAGTWVAGYVYEAIAPEAIYLALVVAMVLALLGLLGTRPQFKDAQATKDVATTGAGKSGKAGEADGAAATAEVAEMVGAGAASEAGKTDGVGKASETDGAVAADDSEAPVTTRDLLTNKPFLIYLVFMGMRAAAVASPNTYFPSYLVDVAGWDTTLVSTILSVAVVCELPLVLFSAKFMDRVPNKVLLVTAFSAVLAQMLSYGLMLPAPLQVVTTLLGKHPAGMLLIMTNLKVINTIVDKRQQLTALALVSTAQSLMTIVMNAASGPILDAYGYQAMFLFNLAVCAVAYLLMLGFKVKDGNGSGLFN